MKPYLPPDLTRAEVSAVRALYEGKADAGMQKLALDMIISKLCGTHDFPYRPDDSGGDRDTCIALGKMLVGIRLRQIIVQPADFFVNEQEKSNDAGRSGSRSDTGRQPATEGTRRRRSTAPG